MLRADIEPGMELLYGGGPLRGGWFTICCRVEVVRVGVRRILVKYLEGERFGRTAWVTAPCLTIHKN